MQQGVVGMHVAGDDVFVRVERAVAGATLWQPGSGDGEPVALKRAPRAEVQLTLRRSMDTVLRLLDGAGNCTVVDLAALPAGGPTTIRLPIAAGPFIVTPDRVFEPAEAALRLEPWRRNVVRGGRLGPGEFATIDVPQFRRCLVVGRPGAGTTPDLYLRRTVPAASGEVEILSTLGGRIAAGTHEAVAFWSYPPREPDEAPRFRLHIPRHRHAGAVPGLVIEAPGWAGG
jgi:hypothetical protein